ncbi:MAG: hypothetical protein GC129_06380 [Proteobacteria bacterium]|nr:hypothetical protein [Pseudomonadota bacterium]
MQQTQSDHQRFAKLLWELGKEGPLGRNLFQAYNAWQTKLVDKKEAAEAWEAERHEHIPGKPRGAVPGRLGNLTRQMKSLYPAAVAAFRAAEANGELLHTHAEVMETIRHTLDLETASKAA